MTGSTGAEVRVKICGVTRPEDAELAAGLGAAWVGLNFWPPSPRFLEISAAREIVAALQGRSAAVGVFVNQEPGRVAEIRDALGLDLVQLHGDEGPEVANRLGGGVLRAVGIDDAFDPAALASWSGAWGFLFDVRDPVRYGGTGRAWPYERVRGLDLGKPWLVAGGIRPETVGEVLVRSGARAVDVCSGVEKRPGVKDSAAMRRLFEEVHDGATARVS